MEKLPLHEILKNNSPLTFVLKTIHRRGDHRCCGDILEALMSIQKVSVSISTMYQCYSNAFFLIRRLRMLKLSDLVVILENGALLMSNHTKVVGPRAMKSFSSLQIFCH